MLKKPKSNPFEPPAAVPAENQESASSFNGSVRDSKGRYPVSLNVGGTHPGKKHPGARHVND